MVGRGVGAARPSLELWFGPLENKLLMVFDNLPFIWRTDMQGRGVRPADAENLGEFLQIFS